MRQRQSYVLESLRNVQGFLDDNQQLVGSSLGTARATLDDVVKQLALHALDQGGGDLASRAETARQMVLRKTLRNAHMRPIAEVARQKLRDVPEFTALRMPSPGLGATQLVAAALVMAESAETHRPVFTDVGLPPDFIARLRAAADLVTKSLDGRGKHLGRRSGATAALAEQERRGRSMIRLIDALVVPVIGSDTRLLSAWATTKMIRRRRPVVLPDVLVASPTLATLTSQVA